MNDKIDANPLRKYSDGMSTMSRAERASRIASFRLRSPTNAELEDLYAFDALAARIIDRLGDDATRQPFTLQGEGIDAKAVASYEEDIDLLGHANEAIRSARLYGGSLVVADDGGPPELPLTRPIVSLHVIDGADARPVLEVGTLAEYLNPPAYTLSLGTGMQEVHASRTFRFDGVRFPTRMLAMRNSTTNPGWGPSVLQRIRDDLSRLRAAKSHIADLLHVLSIPGLQIENLKAQLEAADGRAQVMELLSAIKDNMSANGLLAIDGKDKPFIIARDARGAVDMLGSIYSSLVADTDMPEEILTGKTPGGLNTGSLAGPVRVWYDHVGAFRESDITPFTVWVYERSGLTLPAEWTVEWAPLWQPDAGELAAQYKTTAEADAIYAATIGALKTEDVRRARFVDGVTGRIELPRSITTGPRGATIVGLGAEVEPVPEATPADQALNGAQTASLLEIMVNLNSGAITYEQAVGALRLSFPSTTGRESDYLGPKPEQAATMVTGTAMPPAPPRPEPGDAVSKAEAAAAYGLPTAAISYAIKRGELSTWGIGNHVRVSLAEVAELAKRHEKGEVIE